jgi:aspartate/methionine/tyrosine aminotransferase
MAMKAEGIDIIDLSAGEPDFFTPEGIKDAGKKAIDDNFTKYTANEGIPELKKAIIRKLREDNGVEYEPDEIIVSSGAKNCLYNLFVALLNKGEEVIIPAPYWVSYPQQVSLAKANPVIVQTREENGFHLTPEEFRSAITFNTKALILNNPSNPTGATYSREQLMELAEIAVEEGICLIADEIYEKLVYDGFRFHSVASLSEEIKQRTVIINGVSKAYSMTGWRLGYAAGPKDIIAAMAKVQSHNTSNACSVSQMASLEAIRGPQTEVSRMVAEFQKRRNYMLLRMRSIPGVSCLEPKGAFYLFPNFSQYYDKEFEGMQIRNSYGMAYYLLKHARVAIVPGDAFGTNEFIRLSYATSMENIEEGMNRIIDAVRKLEVTKKVRRISLQNTVTKVRSFAEMEPDMDIERRDALVAECEAHLHHDNYYEWNANIGGLIIQLRTNSPHLNDFWIENWYPAQLEADIEPHGVIYAVKGVPGREPRALYSPESKTAILINSAYYAQCQSLVLGMVADIAEQLFDIHSVRGCCVDIGGEGLIILGPPGTSKFTHFGRLLTDDDVNFHSSEFFFVRYAGSTAVADILERKAYLRTDFCNYYPQVIPLFDRSKCENVVTRKEDCTNEPCLQKDKCRLDRGVTHCFSGSRISRAMLDPYWIGGPARYARRTSVRHVLIFKNDRTSPPIAKLESDEAIRILEESRGVSQHGSTIGSKSGSFYNPHSLVRTEKRTELQKRFFAKLFGIADCYAVNTGAEPAEEIHARIRALFT